LIGRDLASADITLLLASGKTVFSAILPKNVAGTEPVAWKIGSRVRVTGICSVQLDARSHAREGVAVTRSFRVLLRSPADIQVLESPSWWTPSHTLLVLGVALAATMLVLAWVVALRRRVAQQTLLLREQAELLKESESRYRHMAHHDDLTGLATRMVLHDRLSVALEAARRHRTGLTLIMFDLDKFKKINDTLGHHAGDEVLRVTANRLLNSVRKSDTVARLGGDEFVILLPDSADLLAAEIIAGKLVASLSVPIPFECDLVPVSVSVGVCTSWAGELSADALMKIADSALYSAKEQGRNRFEILTAEPAPAQAEQ
jgi:diguanylate cyclase (GGDEF)-like protein